QLGTFSTTVYGLQLHGIWLDRQTNPVLIGWLQVEAAVQAAREAFPDWSARSPAERGQVMNKLADLMETHLEEFAQAESRDQAKTGSSCDCITVFQLKQVPPATVLPCSS
uniref:Aldehyde dehydrogenase domain-containing protein n=1 Tax=Hucho hucho TaxID=62062 RepID=A0A4W5LL61_9TELE